MSELKIKFNSSIEQIAIVICIYIISYICQVAIKGTGVEVLLKGMVVSFFIVVPAIFIKNFVKRPNLPGFAWSTLIAAAATLPISPLQDIIVSNAGKIDFQITAIPLLAFAGISIGDKIPQLKKISLKIALIAIVVMCSTYFGSALIAQCVLKFTHMI